MNSLVKIIFLALVTKAMGLVSVDIEGSTYQSFGLVGFGKISSDAVDKYQETIAPGSSVQIESSSLKVDSKGVYHFTAWGLPDRGMNVDGTVNTFSRIHKFNVDFTPKNSSSSDNMIWTYEDTLLLTDFNGQYLSGLDSNTTVTFNGNEVPAVTYNGDGWGSYMNSSSTTTRISLDSESLTFVDGSIENGFWISDEYGPSLIKFDSTGKMIDYIEAPEAILPHVKGELFFSSDDTLWTDPSYSVAPNTDGRTGNHGYEGMDITPDGKYLFTLLQSATVQDGGDNSKSRMNSRLLKYDLTTSPASLVGEYVIVLPTYEENGKTKTAAQSEMRVINENLIMALPRDSDLGRGGEDGTLAIFKHVDFWSLTDAENIVGKYDDAGAQISTSKGVLNSNITPATHYSFIDMLDETELAKFNLHNGGTDDDHMLNEKWEGMALIPVQCTTDEYFLLLISDNDYKTTDGFLNYGKIAFDSGVDVDTQTLMFHIKLPTLPHDQSCAFSSSSPSSSRLISSSVPVSESTKSIMSSSAVTQSSGRSIPAGSSTSQSPSSSSSSSSSTDVRSSLPSSSAPSTDVKSSLPSSSPSSTEEKSASSSLFPSSTDVKSSSPSSSTSSSLTSSTLSSTASAASSPSSSSSSSATDESILITSTHSTFSVPASNTVHTTVVNGVTTTVTEPCEICKTSTGPTSLTTYTTISNGATVTVTEPCELCETNTGPISFTTYTTVSNGATVTVTEPCSLSTPASSTPTSAAPSASTKTVSSSASSGSTVSTSTVSASSGSTVSTSTVPASSGSTESISTASAFQNGAPLHSADGAALLLPAVAALAAAMV